MLQGCLSTVSFLAQLDPGILCLQNAFLQPIIKMALKVVSAIFLLVCFLSQKEGTCETRKKVFKFHFKSSFCSQENQILDF